MVSPGGITLPGSPYRYLTLSPGFPDRLTVVARIDRRGGKVGRWWHLRGGWYVPAVAIDGTAGGLSADGRRLVLTRHEPYSHARGPRETKLAIMRPTVTLRRAPGTGPPHWLDIVRLPGEWAVLAISPDGDTVFLSRHPAPAEVRALDTTTGQLLPEPVLDRDGASSRLDGLAWTQVASRDGRWTYTLFDAEKGKRPFVYALDSVLGRGTRIDLEQLAGVREPYSLHLRLRDGGRRLELTRRWQPDEELVERTLLTIDTASLTVRRPEPRASISRWWLSRPAWFLSYAFTPWHPGNLLGPLGATIVPLGREVGKD